MPFQSKRQLATCYGKLIREKSRGGKAAWDCDKWLAETKNPSCLPSLKESSASASKKASSSKKCRPMRKDEKIVSKVYRGTRGGHYFFVAGVKVYVPKGNENLEWAKKKYGFAG